MAKTTGVVLLTGAITLANSSVFHDEPVDWRVPIATGLAALGFMGAEKIWEQGAVILAYTGLAAVLLTRMDSRVPSPVESALKWWEEGEKK